MSDRIRDQLRQDAQVTLDGDDLNALLTSCVAAGIAPDSVLVSGAMRVGRKPVIALGRCICPVGFGAVADTRCPRHGATAAHTITGPDEVLHPTTEGAA